MIDLFLQIEVFEFIVFTSQGRIQDFRLGGGALKKIAPSGGRHENIWGISCEKSRFYAKKIIFFPIAEGGAKIFGVFRVKNHAPTTPPPPESAPASDISLLSLLFFSLHAYRVIKEKDSRKPVIF